MLMGVSLSKPHVNVKYGSFQPFLRGVTYLNMIYSAASFNFKVLVFEFGFWLQQIKLREKCGSVHVSVTFATYSCSLCVAE